MNFFKKLLKIILLILTAVYILFYNILGGTGIIYEAVTNRSAGLLNQHDYRVLLVAGTFFLASSGLMIASTGTLFMKKLRLSVIAETAGIILCMSALFVIVNTAEKVGITDGNLQPYTNVYMIRHLPSLAHFVVICVFVTADYLSYDNKVLRKKKKQNDN